MNKITPLLFFCLRFCLLPPLKFNISSRRVIEKSNPFYRSQAFNPDNLPIEIIEIMQKIQKSPELQSLLAEKLQLDGLMPYVVYLSNCK